MVSQKLYFALLVNLVVVGLFGCSSEKAERKSVEYVESQTVSKDVDRVIAPYDTCVGHGVFKKTCAERWAESVSPGFVKKIIESDIYVKGAYGKNDVAKVVRQRSPGLRHLYNKFLKKENPNFEGLVKLKLVVNPSGEVDSVSVVQSTTGYKEFDDEIKIAVSRWTFKKVDSGSTMVEIPFEFVKNETTKSGK